MDRFITIKSAKNKNPQIYPQFYGNADAVQKLKDAVAANATVCLHGPSGSGKTFLVFDIVLKDTNNRNFFEITGEHIGSKHSATDLCDRLAQSYAHAVMDDVDTDTYGFREIVERQGKLNRGAMIVIARHPVPSLKSCEYIELKPLNINELVEFGKTRFPSRPLAELVDLAKLARGNIRNFVSSFAIRDKKDNFKPQMTFVHDLVCEKHLRSENPSDYIGKRIEDHGYSWGIIHENYVDSSAVEDTYHRIAEWMSMADVVDTAIYDGNWEMSELFSLYGIVMPALLLDHTLADASMRPGSSWTKYNNFKMRVAKYRSICGRNAHVKLDLDTLQLLHTYCVKSADEAVPILTKYKIDTDDMNIINHLSIITKLKPRALAVIKKKLVAFSSSSCQPATPLPQNESAGAPAVAAETPGRAMTRTRKTRSIPQTL
jgi:hypothetical protein